MKIAADSLSSESAYKRKRPRKSKSNKRVVKLASDQTQALELRRQGLTLREIGEKLGISHTKVGYLIEKGIKEMPVESRLALVHHMQGRLDGIIEALWAKRGDPAAARAMTDAMKTYMALLGLEAPKTQITHTSVAIEGQTPAEARKVMQELFAGAVGPAKTIDVELVAEEPKALPEPSEDE